MIDGRLVLVLVFDDGYVTDRREVLLVLRELDALACFAVDLTWLGRYDHTAAARGVPSRRISVQDHARANRLGRTWRPCGRGAVRFQWSWELRGAVHGRCCCCGGGRSSCRGGGRSSCRGDGHCCCRERGAVYYPV